MFLCPVIQDIRKMNNIAEAQSTYNLNTTHYYVLALITCSWPNTKQHENKKVNIFTHKIANITAAKSKVFFTVVVQIT